MSLGVLQDWLADGGGWEEGGDNVKYSFFSMTKALQALHSQGLVHRSATALPCFASPIQC